MANVIRAGAGGREQGGGGEEDSVLAGGGDARGARREAATRSHCVPELTSFQNCLLKI